MAMVGRRAIVLTARAWAALVSVAVLLAVLITGLCRRGGWSASEWRNMARVAGRVKEALPACWSEQWCVVGAAAAVEKLLLLQGWCHVPLELLRAP